MIPLLFYYLILPFGAAWLLLRFIRRFGADPAPESVRRNCAEDPVERKWFRVLEAQAVGDGAPTRITKLGDFDVQEKAVDAAYQNREGRQEAGRSWLVVDERGDVLQEIS